jgi:hypothetical protein
LELRVHSAFSLLLSLGLAAPTAAFAGSQNQIQGARGDVHGNLNSYGMLGFGGRVEFALVPDGFLTGEVSDELALSVGADVFFSPVYVGNGDHYGGGAYLLPIIAAQWNFYLGNDWSVFPELGLAIYASFDHNGWNGNNGRNYGWIYPTVDAGIGARYHITSRTALLLRASTPGGLQFGVVF